MKRHLFLAIFLSQTLLVTFLLLLNVNILAVHASTPVGGPITSDTTWMLSGSPYIVVSSIDVWQNVTLTIEPGVVVKFDPDRSLEVNGTLIAQGTPENPIVFTSNTPVPARGDWRGIRFTETAVTTTVDANQNYISGSLLQDCVVEFVGGSGVDWTEAAVHLHGQMINRCTVRYNAITGIFGRSWPNLQPTTTWILNNAVYSNTKVSGTIASNSTGIYAEDAVISGNTVYDNEDSFAGGGIYALRSEILLNTVLHNEATQNGGGIAAFDSTIISNTVLYNQSVLAGGGIWASDSAVIGNIVQDNRGNGGCGISASTTFGSPPTSVRDNVVMRNGNIYVPLATPSGGGIAASGAMTVSRNIVLYNELDGYSAYGGGISASRATLVDNIVGHNVLYARRNAGGGGIYLVYDAVLTGNMIFANKVTADEEAHGGGILTTGAGAMMTANTIFDNDVTGGRMTAGSGAALTGMDGVFFANTVIANTAVPISRTGGVEISAPADVHANNIYGNTPFDVTISTGQDISGTNNYWGTTSNVDILSHIFDWYDDNSRGKFLFVPYSQTPNVSAPLLPPIGVVVTRTNSLAELSWQAVPGLPAGSGYHVYYDTDADLFPYDGQGLGDGSSPIDVDAATTVTLSGLDTNLPYYFAVTTYDDQGRESWYAPANAQSDTALLFLPLISN